MVNKYQNICCSHFLRRAKVHKVLQQKLNLEAVLGKNAGTETTPPYLFIFLQLRVVDLSDLGEFGSVVGMFDGVVSCPA